MWKWFLISFAIIIADHILKYLVATRMELYQSIEIIHNLFYVTFSKNAGAAFGILQDQRVFFIVVTSLVLVFIIYYMWKMRDQKGVCLALAMIFGGAIGNFIDRLIMGEVVDFIDVRIFGYPFPIFNIADSFIVIGATLLIIYTLREGKASSS